MDDRTVKKLLLAAGIAYLLLPLDFRIPLVEGVLDLTPWRVFFMVCAVPSLISALYFHQFPESPKFLMSKGREQEALHVFRKIYAMNTGQDPETYPVSVRAGRRANPAINDVSRLISVSKFYVYPMDI